MCLILFAHHYHPEYKLILAANRDEFYHRKTAPANFWDEHPGLLAGKDLEAGGTWLGMHRNGKIAMLTNYRDLRNLKSKAPSRGQLVLDYLTNGHQPHAYLEEIKPEADEYNGFNLLLGYPDELSYLSNYGNGIVKVPQGVVGISNHLLETPWPKVQAGKAKLQHMVDNNKLDAEELLNMLTDENTAPDHQLPDTGLPLERERALSSMFIKSPGYGSRSSTVILVNKNNEVSFTERVYDVNDFSHQTNTFRFKIG
ncbi:MAG TPA: NRDE family protein [Cyclobacteriaceae bacterium]|nr:NRDE family protein [Cyclobacteriaceae bacterium]